jgi:hypothetical protein
MMLAQKKVLCNRGREVRQPQDQILMLNTVAPRLMYRGMELSIVPGKQFQKGPSSIVPHVFEDSRSSMTKIWANSLRLAGCWVEKTQEQGAADFI